MRAPLRTTLGVAMLLVAGCKKVGVAGELDRSQCGDLVRKQDRLRIGQTGGALPAAQRTERARINRCVEIGTERAYRCVMSAHSAADLEACDVLFD